MTEQIKTLISEYTEAINRLEEDRKNDKLTISNAYRVAKIGVYGKVIADLEGLLEEEE